MKFGLNTAIIQRFHEVFQRHPEISEVLIYGSRAKGNFREGSDVDITFKGENLNQELLKKIEQELDALNTPYLLDVSIYHQLTSKTLLDHIDRMGKTFYPDKTATQFR